MVIDMAQRERNNVKYYVSVFSIILYRYID